MSTHHTLVSPSRFHSAQFCYFPLSTSDPTQREYLFVACEDGKTRVFDVSKPNPKTAEQLEEMDGSEEEEKMDPVALLVGHKNR